MEIFRTSTECIEETIKLISEKEIPQTMLIQGYKNLLKDESQYLIHGVLLKIYH